MFDTSRGFATLSSTNAFGLTSLLRGEKDRPHDLTLKIGGDIMYEQMASARLCESRGKRKAQGNKALSFSTNTQKLFSSISPIFLLSLSTSISFICDKIATLVILSLKGNAK